MWSFFNQIYETAQFIGQKANDAWEFIGSTVKPVVQKINGYAKTASDMVRNSGIPFTSTIADTIDIGTGVVDYLVDGYDKIDKFKNNLISGRKKAVSA